MVKVYAVLTDTDREGPAADGTIIFRFRTRAEADRHASKATTYGRPAKVSEDTVPVRLARRWGLA